MDSADTSEGFVLAPHFRGYAHLGIGAYLINHSAAGNPAELVISIATEEEKAGRVVGDERPNPDGNEIQPEVIAVRLRFENVAGLDALEQQLRHLRAEHFPPDSVCFRVWPDGTVQSLEEGGPYDWMSDDYGLVWANSPEEALRKVGAQSTPQPADVRADQPLSES